MCVCVCVNVSVYGCVHICLQLSLVLHITAAQYVTVKPNCKIRHHKSELRSVSP
jgi:hypothetical protein